MTKRCTQMQLIVVWEIYGKKKFCDLVECVYERTR